jgi:hypothetical protein
MLREATKAHFDANPPPNSSIRGNQPFRVPLGHYALSKTLTAGGQNAVVGKTKNPTGVINGSKERGEGDGKPNIFASLVLSGVTDSLSNVHPKKHSKSLARTSTFFIKNKETITATTTGGVGGGSSGESRNPVAAALLSKALELSNDNPKMNGGKTSTLNKKLSSARLIGPTLTMFNSSTYNK